MLKKLLNISDLTKGDLDTILNNAKNISEKNSSDLKNKNIGLIFEKYSTRTRLSFQVGILQLNGNPIDIKLEELNLQRGESFDDTFKILALYLDAIVYRTNDHIKLINAFNAFEKPIINGLSDLSHPCQIISDCYTLKEHFKSLENLSISWFGDMNNVLFSYFELLNFYPSLQLNVFTHKSVYEKCIKKFPNADNVNFFFEIRNDIIKNSDCIMTDVFTSMNDINKDKEKTLKNFQVNIELLNMTKESCVFMHCLPANKGIEVTEEVLMSSKSIIMQQAKNRLVAQKGILQWLNI